MNPISYLLLIVKIVVNLYITILILRFLVQMVKAERYNPIVQAIEKVTNPILNPVRIIIRPAFGQDFAALVIAIVFTFAITALLHINLPIIQIIGWAFVELVQMVFTLYIIMIIVISISTWFMPYQGYQHPLIYIFSTITSPVTRPFRRLIPPISGVDISPFFAILTLGFIENLLIYLLKNIFALQTYSVFIG